MDNQMQQVRILQNIIVISYKSYIIHNFNPKYNIKFNMFILFFLVTIIYIFRTIYEYLLCNMVTGKF